MSSTSAVREVENLPELKKLLATDKLTIIDFYATWCPPCKAIEPIYKSLADKVPEVQFTKVNVDLVQDVAGYYGITAMPTFVFVKNGDQVDTIRGANPPKLLELIKEYSGVDASKA